MKNMTLLIDKIEPGKLGNVTNCRLKIYEGHKTNLHTFC